MRLRISSKSKEREIEHWPTTSGDIALAVPCSPSLVRYYTLIGVARPHTDSRGRRLFIPEHLQAIREYRERHGKSR
jgi:DNA-binding transcriptional MerR regulator